MKTGKSGTKAEMDDAKPFLFYLVRVIGLFSTGY